MNRPRYLNSDSTAQICVFTLAVMLTMLPVTVAAEDTYVHAESPGYDIVVGKDVTFNWHDSVSRKQRSFELRTSEGDKSVNSSAQEFIWWNFPFGSGHWSVAIYNWVNTSLWIGTTSTQNFYHYNNIPNTTNYRLEPFEYKRGARNLAQTRDLTIFYEITKDYRIDLTSYFTDINKLPLATDPLQGVWQRTEAKRKDLHAYVEGLDNIESDFLKLDEGVLTIKKGYRWDGTSNPFVWEEKSGDLRSSCVHDVIYDLMRMNYLDPDKGIATWKKPGYMNRLMADMMHYMIAVEDKDKTPFWAQSDYNVLRFGGQGKTDKDKLLRAFKFRISQLTAWVAEDGKIDLHWLPANKTDDDPKDYHTELHRYDIYRTTSNASEWSYIGSKIFDPADMPNHTDSTVYFTDPNVINGEIYYYWARVNDLDSDNDGWTDQEENDYGLGFTNSPGLHPKYNEKHYDESVVEAVIPAIGPGNALQLDGIDQFVISTTEPGISTDTSWTFEAWVYPENGNDLSTILALSGMDPIYTGNYTPLTYNNVTNQFCYVDYFVTSCNESTPIIPDSWYHLAVTIAGDEGVLYVNGVPEVTFTPSLQPEKIPSFGIGASFDIDKVWDEEAGEDSEGAWAYDITTSNHFKGKIDELRVWNEARTQEEIFENMFDPLRGDQPDLVALWHFDESDRTHTAYDATINGRDGEVYECTVPKKSCFVASNAMEIPPVTNMPPVARCTDTTVPTEAGACHANTSVDNGSYDPDGDSLTLLQEPAGPYGLGDTDVTLTVTDELGNSTSCTATVTVVDGISPVPLCNTPDTIVPPDVPISFMAMATDNCAASSVEVTQYEFYKFTKKSKRIDKTEDSMADLVGDTITILDSGGVDTHIAWNVIATDNSGNTSGETCEVIVANPGRKRPAIDFSTEVNAATVSLTINDPDLSDDDVESVMVFWGDRNRSEYIGALPITIDHTYVRTNLNYHIRVKTVTTGGDKFNYTFTHYPNLQVSIP